MDGEVVLVLDLHGGEALGVALREILSSREKEGVVVRHERPPCGDGEGAAPDLALVGAPAPAVVWLVLSRGQLGIAGRLVAACRRRWPDAPVVALVEEGEPSELFGLFRHGADDFITPPLRAADILPRLWRLLGHARQSGTLLQVLKEQTGLRQLVGESEAFVSAVRKIPLTARSDAGVLITGETGTGKEVCARAIHYLGPRAGQPFVPVNCGAIPSELIENELFGHERGAFTGAVAAQVGLVRSAEGGTLFLDEIDCMPPHMQVKLLRFLQEKEYRPLGSAKTLRADVRVIAATNSDCGELVGAGRLRQDLYYRLNVIPLRLPPLRERRDDIPLLARHFLDKFAAAFGRGPMLFDADALLLLTMLDWPGNVRELENVVERAVALSEESLITPEHLNLPPSEVGQQPSSFKEAKGSFVAQFERTYIQKLLVAYRGNVTQAARAARKNRRAFWQLIRKHHIDVRSLRPGLEPE